MICNNCAEEADGIVPERADCWECGKDIALVQGDGTHSLGSQKGPRYHWHKMPRTRYRCPASGKTAVWGHTACAGPGHCDCRHLPVGSRT